MDSNLREWLWGDNPAKNIADAPALWISNFLPAIYMIASLILLVYIVMAGFVRIATAGSAEQKDQGKQAITNALLGYLLIFASYWIIQLVQFLTGIPILKGLTG